jgi:hypothetical protein
MSAGRRGLLLSVAFLGLALGLCPQRRAHAQPGHFPMQPDDPGTGRHTLWNRQLTPEQIRELLARFGQPDGKGDPFEDLLRRLIGDRNPGVPKEQVDAAVKRFMQDKEFRDRVIDLAQKQKNQARDNGDGPPPKLTPQDRARLEDLAKQLNIRPDGGKDDPFKLPDRPKFDPNALPPFDPNNPNFDPERFPAIKPDNPPKFDPKTKFPLDPETGQPFDPRDGKPIDPKNPPKIDPVEPPPPPVFDPRPKVDPMNPPRFDPKTGRPIDPMNPADDMRRFDPDNPLGAPKESPQKAAQTRAAEAATALWEKNVGPIDESPAVKRAIVDLVSDQEAMDALTDGRGNNLLDMLTKEGGGEDGLGKLLDGGGNSGWEWPKLDLNLGRGRDWDFDTGRPRERNFDLPDAPRSRGTSAFDGMGGFQFGGVTVPWLLMLILLALAVAAAVWWKWEVIFQPKPALAAAGGVGPWPIDPRAITTREDVVKAFEYLSVLICGPAAKTWTHSTIADELTALAATHGETAVKLARLYELARYAPLDEPLTRAELVEARRLVCDLAGIDE